MWSLIASYLLLLAAFRMVVFAHSLEPIRISDHYTRSPASASCFPALGFKMPVDIPSSLNNWWCDPHTEYAFVGFSYEVTQCTSSRPCEVSPADVKYL